MICNVNLCNQSSFQQEHPGVPDGSDCSDGTSYCVTENHTQPVAQATGRIAYRPCAVNYTISLYHARRRVIYYTVDAHCLGVTLPLLCVCNVVMYMYHQNDTCVTLFAGAPVTL